MIEIEQPWHDSIHILEQSFQEMRDDIDHLNSVPEDVGWKNIPLFENDFSPVLQEYGIEVAFETYSSPSAPRSPNESIVYFKPGQEKKAKGLFRIFWILRCRIFFPLLYIYIYMYIFTSFSVSIFRLSSAGLNWQDAFLQDQGLDLSANADSSEKEGVIGPLPSKPSDGIVSPRTALLSRSRLRRNEDEPKR